MKRSYSNSSADYSSKDKNKAKDGKSSGPKAFVFERLDMLKPVDYLVEDEQPPYTLGH
jgi:hypothetical protein